MDKFANKPDAERHDFFQEAANRRGVSTVIMEKDFWVCWTLKKLFANPTLASHITFKGGTSLSKAHHLIERFSEDIDLTISRHAPHVVDGMNPMEEGISGKEREKRIKTLKQNAQRFVKQNILPALEKDIRSALEKDASYKVVLDENDPDQQTILFYYPKVFGYGKGFGRGKFGVGLYGEGEEGYIRPHIKLEFGARGETEPSDTQTISPYIAEAFPDLFTERTCVVPTLSAERSFWEKVTILHALYHGVKMRDRMSRHYYDTYMMDQKGITTKALRDVALLEQVVRNKSLFFRDAKASYETATIGGLRLVPEGESLQNLKKDYAAMSEMFMGEYPTFAAIIKGLAELGENLNKPHG